MNVPLLRYIGYPINKSIGSAAAIGFIIALFGALGFLTSRSSNQAYATPEDNEKYLTLMRELTEQNGGTLVVIN